VLEARCPVVVQSVSDGVAYAMEVKGV
jgi:hypothetical protein